MTLKLYYHPVSTTCRPIILLAAAEKLELDYQLVDLFNGENCQPAFTAINPNQAVPFLQDDEFSLAESSAILKYLADKQNSPAYPKDLRMRARVIERMDWFNTGLYRDLGYGFIYPQVIEAYRCPQPEVQVATLLLARKKAKKWLNILDANIIGRNNSFVCGDEPTLAAMFAKGKTRGIDTRGMVDHGMVHSIYFRDPNGYVIELTSKMPGHDEAMNPAASRARQILDKWQAAKQDRAPS